MFSSWFVINIAALGLKGFFKRSSHLKHHESFFRCYSWVLVGILRFPHDAVAFCFYQQDAAEGAGRRVGASVEASQTVVPHCQVRVVRIFTCLLLLLSLLPFLVRYSEDILPSSHDPSCPKVFLYICFFYNCRLPWENHVFL